MDIKHSINPVRRFDLFMRNTRRTGVLRGFQHNTEMSIGINPQSIVVVNQNWTPNKGSPVGVHTTLLFNEG